MRTYNLHEYLFYSKMTVKDFAAFADFSDAFLCRVLNGKQKPSAKTLRVIERVTGGKVTASSALLPIQFPDEKNDEEGGRAA